MKLKLKNRKKLLLIAGGAAIVIVATAFWFGDHRASAADFITARVTRGAIRYTVSATGTLQAVTTVQVGSQISGRIAALNADFNSSVRKGQVIAQIDPAIYQAQVGQARANLEQARANLADAKAKTLAAEATVENLRAGVSGANANLAALKAQRDDANNLLRRHQELATSGVITQRDLESAQSAYAAAEARYEQASAQVTQARADEESAARAGLAQAQAQVEQAQAQVQQTEAALRLAEVNLNYTTIRSPTIFDRVSPAVVFIYATSINPYRTTDRVEHVVGSGFIFDAAGLVLTNSHVAFGRQTLIVALEDGTTAPAQLVGADPIFDIAVLRIPKPEKGSLPVVALGDSDRLHVGEEMLAIGNPLGLDQSLTRGIVSAINRVLPETFFSLREPLIQIDAPINPGNSGGPLLDRCGEVVGITTAIIPDAQNIGFAVPINLAKEVIPSLVAEGRLVRPWLGFHGQFVDHELQGLLRIPLDVGFLVEVVEPGSPAANAGLRGGELEFTVATRDFLLGGDIITKINGRPLNSPDNILDALQEMKVGAAVNLTVFREGKYLEVKYTLPERPLLPGDITGQSVAAPLAGRSAVKMLPRNSSFRF